MFLFKRKALNSKLLTQDHFYGCFLRDLKNSKKEVIIESPFITVPRLRVLKPFFEKLINRRVKVFIITKDPSELDENMSIQAESGIQFFEELGVQVVLCKGHHRKLAIIDRNVLWEGSLNILSQSCSREFMRRINSKQLTEETFKFLKLEKCVS
jgi:phosphatidylserine/phosphatidylglycerophosphate/cardiolipin synthase-like enzyme